MIQGCIVYILSACLLLALVLHFKQASLWSGIALVNVLLSVLAFFGILYAIVMAHASAAIVNAGGMEETALAVLKWGLGAGLVAGALVLVSFPLLFVGVYFVEGVRLVRKEGLSMPNLLSIGFAIGLLVFVVWTPSVGFLRQSPWIFRFAYYLLACSLGYFVLLLSVLFFSLVAGTIHWPCPKKLDCIIVLGCGIFGTQVTPLLAGRIEKGLQLHKSSPGSKVLFSGGQGPGEDIPEACAMAAYARAHGLEEEAILIEDKSLNTEQNIAFSKEVMAAAGLDPQNSRTAIVTTQYHVFRALVLARNADLKAKGYGSRTKLYFALNAFLRECVGYLSLTRKKQIWIALLIIVPMALLASL